jgi:transcription termination factor NusA
MRSEFMLAINQLCAERKISSEVVLQAVEAALISAYKRNFGAAANIEVQIEESTGDVRVFAVKEVVEDVQDPKTQVLLEEARQLEPELQLGETVLIESTPRDFGRIAAQTAKQVILQRVREAERDALYSSFVDRAGEIAHGTIQTVDYHSRDVIVNLDGAEAILPAREQVPSERYRRGTRLRAYVLEVRRGNRGPQITLSRRTPALLRRLMELEVPEIFNGMVEIKNMAREAGSRSKVAVHATQEGVDPVGSCVGVRGGRIQNVVNELGGEKIDVVQWHSEVGTFIANSLSPAKVMNVLLDDSPETGKTATVIVPDRQLSLAIGKEGQNARLAAKLTGWRIDIKSATEAAEETLGRFEDTPLAPDAMDLLTYAEVLLHQRDMADLTDEEKTLIEKQLTDASDAGLSWPEEEPVIDDAESETAKREVLASSEEPVTPEEAVAAAGADAQVAVVEDGAAQEAVTEGQESVLEGEAAAAEVAPDEALAETGFLGGAELEPSFTTEPIEESLGWVVTHAEEDYYSGWEDVAEETPDQEQEQWVPEPFEEPGESPKPGKKGKRKKRGGKSRYLRSSRS